MLSIRIKCIQWLMAYLLDYQEKLETKRWLKQMRSAQYQIPSDLSAYLGRDIGLTLEANEPEIEALHTDSPSEIDAHLHHLHWPPTGRRKNIQVKLHV